ncbi:MAG: hypothetical protein K6T16_01520, partial [Candidatus Pacearchaeota archaeon]|nr:hypothetical protein [Candidatus Pacearchaeota archaeon]
MSISQPAKEDWILIKEGVGTTPFTLIDNMGGIDVYTHIKIIFTVFNTVGTTGELRMTIQNATEEAYYWQGIIANRATLSAQHGADTRMRIGT